MTAKHPVTRATLTKAVELVRARLVDYEAAQRRTDYRDAIERDDEESAARRSLGSVMVNQLPELLGAAEKLLAMRPADLDGDYDMSAGQVELWRAAERRLLPFADDPAPAPTETTR